MVYHRSGQNYCYFVSTTRPYTARNVYEGYFIQIGRSSIFLLKYL